MELRKIVVGIDFSAEAQLALDHAVDLARLTGAELLLVHVCPQAASPVEAPSSLALRFAEIGLVQGERDRGELKRAAAHTRDRGVAASELVVDGHPDSGLAEAAAHVDADLIAVGTHGRSGLTRLLLGSVAERTARLAETNVLVARGPRPGAAGYRRVLVPTDFSTPAERALRLALRLAAPGGAVDLLHCWSAPLVTTDLAGVGALGAMEIEPLRDDLRAHARRRGERLVEAYGGGGEGGGRLHFTAVEDAPAHGIQERARADGCDLIAIGSHGYRGLRRWLLGSVAEATIRHAPCAVLVVHASEDDETP